MDIQNYQKLAARTLPQLSSKQEDIQHMIFGMMTELGELVDSYKKHYAYGKQLDEVNVMEELGDIMWYWAGLCTITGINPSYALITNIDKLSARYPEFFDKTLALVRDLEKEREILNHGYGKDEISQ